MEHGADYTKFHTEICAEKACMAAASCCSTQQLAAAGRDLSIPFAPFAIRLLAGVLAVGRPDQPCGEEIKAGLPPKS